MRRFNYLFGLFIFTLFIPKVYAFTYELETSVSNLNVKKGTETEIKVSLKNVEGTEYGIASCSLNIDFDSNIVLNSKVRSLGNWTLTAGKIYLLDTGDPVFTNGDLLVIPVKVNGNGSVKLSNIECSDGAIISNADNKSVNFMVTSDGGTNNNNGSGNTNGDDTNNNVTENSNCDLSDIILSEGTLEFDADVTDYYIEVNNYDNLIVEPILVDNRATFDIEKTDDKKIIINVSAQDGSYKKYTIFVEENSVGNSSINEENKSSNKYVPIFIGIICILVLINVFRIVKNMKK